MKVCPECSTSGGWLCSFHQSEGVKQFAKREAILKQSAIAINQASIDRLCATYELESDEFQTAEQKAKEIQRRFAHTQGNRLQ